MNLCHSPKSAQQGLNTCPSSNLNSLMRRFGAITFRLKSVLSDLWDIVSTPAANEPRIWQKRDHSGQTYWQVYDPATDRSISFGSEQEVIHWLEQRFYNRYSRF